MGLGYLMCVSIAMSKPTTNIVQTPPSNPPTDGPVLSQTDLYLLSPLQIQIHPIFTNSQKSFHLNFNLSTGQTGGFNADDPHQDLPFVQRDESAVLPRMQELYVITKYAPWCTHVRNTRGVTLGDVCAALWRE